MLTKTLHPSDKLVPLPTSGYYKPRFSHFFRIFSFGQPAKEKSHRLSFAASCVPALGRFLANVSFPLSREENEIIIGHVDIVVFSFISSVELIG